MKIINIICSDGISGHEKPILEMQNFLYENEVNTEFYFFTKNKKLSEVLKIKKLKIKNLEIIIYSNILELFKKIFFIIKNNQKNIIHSHLTLADIFCSFVKIIIGNYKLITTRPYDYSHNYFKKYFYLFIYKFFCKFDLQICISEKIANLVENFEKCNKNKIHIVHYGLLTNSFTNNKFISNTNKKIKISMVGRLLSWKNHYQIILHLKNSNFFNFIKLKNISFTIYGDGPLLNFLTNEIKNNNLTQYIEVKNDIINQNDIFAETDILLHPSLFEGFGLVAIEAMSYKIPIICNSKLGMSASIHRISPKLVIDINSSVQLINTISYVINNYSDLSLKSYETFIDNFTIHSMTKNYLTLYKYLDEKN